MKNQEFTDILVDQIERSKEMLLIKAEEYATDDDRLHNFVVAAQLQGGNLPQALAGFMAKHTVSIYDMIESGRAYPMSKWEEKITDHINYLLILRAVLEEKGSEVVSDLEHH